jgi:hypothetical protein
VIRRNKTGTSEYQNTQMAEKSNDLEANNKILYASQIKID